MLRKTGESASLVIAACLLATSVWRWRHQPEVSWTAALVIAVLGIATADFLSGLLHWIADTWGSAEQTLIGRRFLRPFRLHHANPKDILERGFIELNGDVALVISPVLTATLSVPLDTWWGFQVWQYLITTCAAGLFTNQVHQWAHASQPPVVVRWMQNCGLLLNARRHTSHHQAPFATDYCITTGWCNPLLHRMRFFARLERAVSAITGAEPRRDEQSFATMPS